MTARSDSFDELALPDLARRVANGVRFGVISAVDHAAARVRVTSGEIVTAWLPWATGRAAGPKRRWDPPAVGEQVVVIAPGGDLTQAIVIPGVYQDTAAAPSDSPDKDTTLYGDGALIEYDRASHTYTLDVPASGKIILKCGATTLEISNAGVVLTAPNVDFNLG